MKPDRSNPDIAAYLDWAADYPCLPSHRVTWLAAVEWARKDAVKVIDEIVAQAETAAQMPTVATD